jgi:membrane protein DedA with SNARE-associated domain
MRLPWFVLHGLFFVPASLPGWIIAAGALGYSVYAFIDIDRRSHSVSDVLINFVFRLLLVMLAWTVIAWATSRSSRHQPPAARDKS